MIDLNIVEFKSQFRALVDSGASDEELDEIDNQIQHALSELNTDCAASCAQIAVDILSGANRPWSLAYALNTHISACCMSGDIKGVRLGLERLIELTIEHKTVQAALSAAENVHRFLPGNVRTDQVPHILNQIVHLYQHLGMVEKAIATLITAAYLFADYGTFQTAYRSLADSEDLARNHSLLQKYVDVLEAMHCICVIEGDHSYAERVWATLQEKYVELGKPIPPSLAINHATALLQTELFDQAKEGFEEILALTEPDSPMQFAVLMNLSVCLRRLGDRAQAEARMVEARQHVAKLDPDRIDREQLLELELIAAKNAIEFNNMAEVAACLNRATEHLDAAVQLVEKLHYRRGLRERYIRRMEDLLAELPSNGRAADVLTVIASTRTNRVVDWLHLLSWAKELSVSLSEEEKSELDTIVFRLAKHGAPHLYGYREKYDDPMAGLHDLVPDPWRDFAEYSDAVCARHSFRRPFQNATARNCSLVLEQRLSEGYGIFVNLLTADKKAMLVIGERYVTCPLPDTETKNYFRALEAHRHGQNTSIELSEVVEAYQTALLVSLDPILAELASAKCKGVIFVPDQMDLTPINLVMIGHPMIRKKMANAQFEVRTCLALYPRHSFKGLLRTCLGVIEDASNLRYDRAEVEIFCKTTGAVGTILVDPEWEAFENGMDSADSLVVSQHGMSISLYTDPYFANMTGPYRKSVMSLDEIQQNAYRWTHRLVLLGTCHSGGFVNRNFQGHFKSHELMGFPTVFLLNGQCEVLAASWAILDKFNVLLTTLFARELDQSPSAIAFSTALAKLFNMPNKEVLELLSSVHGDDDSLPPEALASLGSVDVIRRKAFCYGAYQIYSLL